MENKEVRMVDESKTIEDMVIGCDSVLQVDRVSNNRLGPWILPPLSIPVPSSL
jgi:hypothetical protein